MVGDLDGKATAKSGFGRCLSTVYLVIKTIVERLLTFCYYESLQRNTIEPLNRIIATSDHGARSRLLREWAELKAEESKYIQIAVCVAQSQHPVRTDQTDREASCSRRSRRV